MSLAPDLATPDPRDFYLFLANDNDFLTTDGVMLTTDGQIYQYSDPIDNDTMFLVYRVAIDTSSGCYADCNRDSLLTVADFGCFQTKFVGGDPYADCNQGGTFTIADFACFQTRFVAGCP